VGLRSSNPTIRGNAIEFLDNVLKPELRQLLVPLLDSSVTVAERIALANGLVGAPLETPEQAVETLLASEDSWLRSCAVYAIGAMQLEELEGALDRLAQDQDPAVKQAVQNARRRLAGISDTAAIPVPVPPTMGVGIGSG
jgi:HEAT repeat protein